ncbi:uncharacterized protein N7483_002519 [Penicillium malachiteum]|uniref:uncharacterized protein n=1 Tax=Penicillium malachiteum TaxID=1324776 RepID=UPI002546B965|nr:uncharacterized protein N7483_002519 [Penicillium malachiteum]KAJ5737394.1 hypothetical protein N7483_002519 [Penicillium malachiteum]
MLLLQTPFSFQRSAQPFWAEHYATISLDQNGRPFIQVSPSLRGREQLIFSQEAVDQFTALARKEVQTQVQPSNQYQWYLPPIAHWAASNEEAQVGPPSLRWRTEPNNQSSQAGKDLCESQQKMERSDARSSTMTIQVGDEETLRKFYRRAFEMIQQLDCREIAKIWIMKLEPRKQTNFPYKGYKLIDGKRTNLGPDATKPPWWPRKVTHKEPDHLQKDDRLDLLVHILCGFPDTHRVRVAKLREWTRDKMQASKKLKIIEEIYQVREKEESFLCHKTDASVHIRISQVDIGLPYRKDS